ncbi:MAG: Arc family DNA-binding protein [Tabrizicola sp.]|nr:Arc family DNA-binding protein [Tabrizicola sp.]
MSPAPSQSQDKFILRLPDGMRDHIRIAAEANNRSMNAEIIARLSASLRTDLRQDPGPLDVSYDRGSSEEMRRTAKALEAFAHFLRQRATAAPQDDDEIEAFGKFVKDGGADL